MPDERSWRPHKARPHARAKAAERLVDPDASWAETIAQLALEACHPTQRLAVGDPSRFFTWLTGRGGGKTTAFKAKLIIGLASVRRGRFLYVAPTLGMATELLWDPLKDFTERLDAKGLKVEADYKEIGKTCTFPRTGARLKLVGADDRKEMDKQRGQAFDGVAIDETAVFAPDLIEWFLDRIIIPRLGERSGWIGLASTPGHYLNGFFYDRTRPDAVDADGEPMHRPGNGALIAGYDGWVSYHWSLKDVATLPEATQRYPAIVANYLAALQTKARNKWSDDNPIWKREYEGVWARDNTTNIFQYRARLDDGTPWNEWDPTMEEQGPDRLQIATLPLGADGKPREDWLYACAMDHGSKDPFALNVFAASPSDVTRTIYHVFGFEKQQMFARRIAVLLLGPLVEKNLEQAHAHPGGLIGAIGWPSGMVSDIAQLGQNILDELSQVYGIKVLPAEQKGKLAAIELVNSDLVDGRLKILKGSRLAQQLADLQWVKDEYGFPREDKGQANHSSDTLLYSRRLLANLFDQAAEELGDRKARRESLAQDARAQNDGGIGEFDYLFSDDGGYHAH